MEIFMSNTIEAVFMILGAYMLGSIPWGFIIGRIYGVDVRTVGSKNIGATNVTRTVGKIPGKICFVLDFLKGALPVIAAQYVFRNASTVPMEYVVIAALFATVLGHMFPVFLKFKGGKGVSTAAGAVMALTPYALLAALLVWVVVFLASRYVSLASIAAAAVLPIVAWVFYLVDFGNQLARSPEVLIFLTIVSLLAILRHHANIVRLLNGTENRFGKK
jgi:glycerol-3-phosphate acyltransferase PlsY